MAKKRVKLKLHEIDKIEFWFKLQDELFRNSLIVYWFDSVGIYVGVYPNNNISSYLAFEMSINDDWIGEELTRQEATIQAIKKANDIYNAKTS
ncbi:hypothetical protein ACTS9C_05355 [Empedobacter brevis]